MGFNCGIVGLPNVGKSTLFNALTATQAAEAANFPFCTIEPNTGRVSVPDARLNKISGISKSKKLLPTQLEFVDIAGLVRGASKGEGLGNQFLAKIREVDAIIYMLRCFEDDNITHVEGSVDPLRDLETIETELMLSDMESLEKRLPSLEKKQRGGDKEAAEHIILLEQSLQALQNGKPARTVPGAQKLGLLTAKPVLYVCNVDEDSVVTGNAHSAKIKDAILISAAIEAEISVLEADEKQEFLQELGLQQSGLDRIIHAGYKLLNLITFFTSGPQETRAWTITKGTKAPQAAGTIHTDFEHGFIKAETISCDAWLELGGEQACREAGKVRQEGKGYIVEDGDIMLFRFNV